MFTSSGKLALNPHNLVYRLEDSWTWLLLR